MPRKRKRIANLSDDGDVVDKDEREYFVYTEGEGEIIPRDVTHVRVHSSVKTNKDRAFCDRGHLAIVILNDELEAIEEETFRSCTTLQLIKIPNTVKAIRSGALYHCSGITTVSLGDGLEEIGCCAFRQCTSLEQIAVPNSVKEI